jgi:hypothetical protein
MSGKKIIIWKEMAVANLIELKKLMKYFSQYDL